MPTTAQFWPPDPETPPARRPCGHQVRRLVAVAALVLAPLVQVPRADAWVWQHAGIDSSGDDLGQYNSIAVGSGGRIHASYYRYSSFSEGDRNLMYATRMPGSSAWSTTTADPGESNGTFSSIALAPDGTPHVAYYQSEFANLRHAWYDSSQAQWSTETVDAAGTVGQHASIAVSPGGTVYIAYFDATTPALKVASLPPGGSWTLTKVDTFGVVGLYTSITARSGVHVAYFDLTFTALKHAALTGSNWTVQTLDNAGDVGRFTSIDAYLGKVFIAYYDNSNHAVKVASREEGMWTVDTVDGFPDVGAGTAVAIDDFERPHMVYYNADDGDLRYAGRFRGVWLPNVVATGGDVGRYSGIAFEPGGLLPHLTYYDESQGTLRHASGSGSPTGVPEDAVPAPGIVLGLSPNPIRGAGRIELTLPRPGTGALRVFDVQGRLLRSVFEGRIGEGTHVFSWDGRDETGRRLSSGVYFLNAVGGGEERTVRVVALQ